MESFKGLIVSLLLISLFAFALLSFGFSLQRNNNADTTILDDGSLSQLNSSISANIQEFNTATNNQLNATNEEQANEQNPTSFITIISIFHSIGTFGGFVSGVAGTILSPTLLGRIGISPMFAGILISLVALILVLVFWRLIKQGQ